MTNNSPDNTKPATHSTDLVLDRVATISDIENRLPDMISLSSYRQ